MGVTFVSDRILCYLQEGEIYILLTQNGCVSTVVRRMIEYVQSRQI